MVLKKGVTLIEITIVVTILAILMIAAVSTLNPIYQMKKGHDATRRKDLKRISIAFEEFYNDKGCYPDQDKINGLDCGSHEFYQLNPWPCDPNGTTYDVIVSPDGSDCPTGFIVTTKLETEKTDKQCNYGVASTNKNWTSATCASTIVTTALDPTNTPIIAATPTVPPCCAHLPDNCMSDADGGCDAAGSCFGGHCYYSGAGCPEYDGHNPCVAVCKTSSCGQ